MGTEYKIIKSNTGPTLSVDEMSNLVASLFQGGLVEVQLTLAEGLTPAALANIAMDLLKVSLYWCGDPEKFCAWLHQRLDECDSSPTHTPPPAGDR